MPEPFVFLCMEPACTLMKPPVGKGDTCEHWIQPLFTLDHGAAYFSLPTGPRVMTNTPAWYTAHVVPLLIQQSPPEPHVPDDDVNVWIQQEAWSSSTCEGRAGAGMADPDPLAHMIIVKEGKRREEKRGIRMGGRGGWGKKTEESGRGRGWLSREGPLPRVKISFP